MESPDQEFTISKTKIYEKFLKKSIPGVTASFVFLFYRETKQSLPMKNL